MIPLKTLYKFLEVAGASLTLVIALFILGIGLYLLNESIQEYIEHRLTRRRFLLRLPLIVVCGFIGIATTIWHLRYQRELTNYSG
jgi:divalent metal cation (Fe/Co/Zn/Cd) transporter